MKNRMAWGLVGVLALVAVAAAGLRSVLGPVPRIKVLIPRGYVGWIRISYAVAGAPALPVERGEYLAKVPSCGLLASSTMPQGSAWVVGYDRDGGKVVRPSATGQPGQDLQAWDLHEYEA